MNPESESSRERDEPFASAASGDHRAGADAEVRAPWLRRILSAGVLGLIGGAGARAAESARESEPHAPTDLHLFLVLGLPNLPPRGKVEPIDRQLHERALLMNKEFGWARAIYPEDWNEQELTAVELVASLGRSVAEANPNWKLGLIPAAFGGKSLDDWMPAGALYRGAIQRAQIAQKDGNLAGILWYQGPTNEAPATATDYAKRFAALIAQLRADLKVRYVPVIVGEVKLGATGPALATPLSEVPQQVIPCFFVSTAGLPGAGESRQLDSKLLWSYNEKFAQAWMDLAQP